MSEQSNETAQTAGAGEGGEIQWGEAGQEVQPVAEAVPVDPAPTDTPPPPEPSAPQTPEPSSDFNFTTLQNGEKELRLESGQVYRGKDDGEIIQKLAKAQFEASRTIRELKQPVQTPPQPQPTPTQTPEPQYDPTTVALADMLAPMFGMKSGLELVQSYRAMQEQIKGFQPIAQQTQMNSIAADFIRATPDFEITPRNSELLGETLDKYGLPLTSDNMRLVHDALKSRGMYETTKPPAPTPTAPRAPTGQFLPRNTMPPPPTATTPTPAPPASETQMIGGEQFVWA